MKTNWEKYILEATVFICGAIVMVFELLGTRLMAPYLGSTIYVWTSLIGVILGSLSLGYYWGGRLADKKGSLSLFSLILFLAGLMIFCALIFSDMVLNGLQFLINHLELYSLFSSLILFAPASVLLGMITPFAVKLKIDNLANTASTVGNLYAISTIGSIFGTFLTGFFLIPFFGTVKVLYILSLLLIILSVVNNFKKLKKTRIIAFFIIFCLMAFTGAAYPKNKFGKVIEAKDTEYNYIQVIKSAYKSEEGARDILILATDPFGIQSGRYLDSDELVFDYTKMFNLSKYFTPTLNNALMIGGSAYSYPIEFLKNSKNASMDVVEIDPGMTAMARKYFNLNDNPNLRIFHEDGRLFLNKNKKKYDAIFNDAYNSFSAIPFHLTTVESAAKMYDSLNSQGLVMVNIISALEGEKADFLLAEYKTFKEIFPQVYVFQARKNFDSKKAQSIILIALKSERTPDFISPDKELANYLANKWDKELKSDLPVLTDDFCPVEYYKSKLL